VCVSTLFTDSGSNPLIISPAFVSWDLASVLDVVNNPSALHSDHGKCGNRRKGDLSSLATQSTGSLGAVKGIESEDPPNIHSETLHKGWESDNQGNSEDEGEH